MSELRNIELLGNPQHTGDQFSVDSNSQSHSIRKTQPDKTLERLLEMVAQEALEKQMLTLARSDSTQSWKSAWHHSSPSHA